jgi:hypothetical protein
MARAEKIANRPGAIFYRVPSSVDASAVAVAMLATLLTGKKLI